MAVEKCPNRGCVWWAATATKEEARAMFQLHLHSGECPLTDDMPDDREAQANYRAEEMP